MAFRTDGLAKAYSRGQTQAIQCKTVAQSASAALAADNQSANAIIQLLSQMKSFIETFDAVAATPGLAAYAQEQENDPAYDVVAEFNAMRAAAVAVRDWIITNFPTSAGGFIEKDTLNADGSITVRQFTPAQTVGLVAALDALVATIA